MVAIDASLNCNHFVALNQAGGSFNTVVSIFVPSIAVDYQEVNRIKVCTRSLQGFMAHQRWLCRQPARMS